MQETSPSGPAQALRGVWQRHGVTIFAALVVAASAVAGLLLHKTDVAIVDTFDKHVGDWRIALGSPRASQQHQKITLVLITENTLLDYESRSPIDRALLAELLLAIDAAGPKAIGVDLIFDRRTRHDARLLQALKQVKAPVVLGAIDTRIDNIPDVSLKIQAEFLKAAGRPYGHVMLGRKENLLRSHDSVIRYVAHSATPSAAVAGAARAPAASGPPPAFADVLATVAGYAKTPGPAQISWLRQPDDDTGLFATLELPRHDPNSLKPGLEGLFRPSWREFLKGRIVLIGAHMIDRDLHATPLSVLDRSQVPGVTIQAQALAQRIDGDRDIRILSDFTTMLISAAVAFGCFVAARRTGLNPHGVLYSFVGVLLIGAASFLAFRLFRVDFPSIALATAWAFGGIGGLASNYWLTPYAGHVKEH